MLYSFQQRIDTWEYLPTRPLFNICFYFSLWEFITHGPFLFLQTVLEETVETILSNFFENLGFIPTVNIYPIYWRLLHWVLFRIRTMLRCIKRSMCLSTRSQPPPRPMRGLREATMWRHLHLLAAVVVALPQRGVCPSMTDNGSKMLAGSNTELFQNWTLFKKLCCHHCTLISFIFKNIEFLWFFRCQVTNFTIFNLWCVELICISSKKR